MGDIRTDYRQDEKPNMVEADYKGSVFNNGRRVAFNYQGSIRLGRIIELKKTEWVSDSGRDGNHKYWRLNFELHIQGDGIDKVSKIKNPNSVVCID